MYNALSSPVHARLIILDPTYLIPTIPQIVNVQCLAKSPPAALNTNLLLESLAPFLWDFVNVFACHFTLHTLTINVHGLLNLQIYTTLKLCFAN